MTLHGFVRLIRQSWLIIVITTIALGSVGALVALVSPPVYRSSSQLFVSIQTSAPDVSDLAQGNSAAQQKVNSYVQVVHSASVLQPVIDQLKLSTTVPELAERITATADVNSVLIDISVDGGDADRVQRIAAAVTTSFIAEVTERLERPVDGGPSLVRIEVVQPATTPGPPVAPRLSSSLALGLAFGLTLGVVLAGLRQTLDTKIRTSEDVARTTDSPLLGSIGFDPSVSRTPLIVQSDPQSPRAEAFRSLRTNVQFVALDGGRRSITVTSAVPSEGKSTTAANLAIAMAENGARVVLVDADLRRPRVAELMGVDGSAGLTDVLIGRAELDDVVVPWGRGGLRVLPAGQIPPNPSELLGSEGMHALLEVLLEQADSIIIDAPPVLPVTDAAILARITGGAVLVSAVGRTTGKQLGATLDTLVGAGGKVLGVVMTMVPSRRRTPEASYYRYERSTGPIPLVHDPRGRHQASDPV